MFPSCWKQAEQAAYMVRMAVVWIVAMFSRLDIDTVFQIDLCDAILRRILYCKRLRSFLHTSVHKS